MALRLERSVEEAHLYMAMRPCDVCGEAEFECRSAVIMAEGDLASRYDGPCAGCGTKREFVFRLPDTVPPPTAELRFGGPEPSELLDAGEWLWAAANFAHEPIGDLGELAAEREADLAGAAVAIDEVLKFVPDGAVGPPDAAFWTDRGRQMRAEYPDDFRRDRLEARRNQYRRVLAVNSMGGTDRGAHRPGAAGGVDGPTLDRGSAAEPSRTIGQ
ncbi:hypothetical protein [Plantactinospora sonchi]|uniref:Uncharacterized protein n=1 Tax=Plantactinospora sonchi TaxID=1544735 RepID=A0ABU7RQX4_9ACTN